MRIYREENPIIKYTRESTPDPPDFTFVKPIPLVNCDNIFDIISTHKSLTDHQRYPFIFFELSLNFLILDIWKFWRCF